MKRGVPPTEWKARTGELTPPGVESWARANNTSFIEEVVIGDRWSGS
jgi:hypothetical protein